MSLLYLFYHKMDIGKCLPNKIFAVTAEGGVFEEPWYELVILDL